MFLFWKALVAVTTRALLCLLFQIWFLNSALLLWSFLCACLTTDVLMLAVLP